MNKVLELERRPTGLDNDLLFALYRKMLELRRFEDRVFHLFRLGLLPGTVHQYQGQEAVAVGVCANLESDDYITSTHGRTATRWPRGCPSSRSLRSLPESARDAAAAKAARCTSAIPPSA